jgi:hypothetical protein
MRTRLRVWCAVPSDVAVFEREEEWRVRARQGTMRQPGGKCAAAGMAAPLIEGRDFGFGKRVGSGKKAKASVEFFNIDAIFGGRV